MSFGDTFIDMMIERDYQKIKKNVEKMNPDRLARAIESVYPGIKVSWQMQAVKIAEEMILENIREKYKQLELQYDLKFRETDRFGIRIMATGLDFYNKFHKNMGRN